MIAAERTLFISSGGKAVPVPVRIQLPVFDRNAWVCNFTIGWPEGEVKHHGMGFDAVQAINLAFHTIAIHLYASEHHKSGRLYFEKPGTGYGFPLPQGGRDQAVGDDRLL
jgi:hypothetical protein